MIAVLKGGVPELKTGKRKLGGVPLDRLGDAVHLDLDIQVRKLARLKSEENRALYNGAIDAARWRPELAILGLTDLCLIDPNLSLHKLLDKIKTSGFLQQICWELGNQCLSSETVADRPYILQYQCGFKYRGKFYLGAKNPYPDDELPLTLHEALTVVVLQGKRQLTLCEMVVVSGHSDEGNPSYARLSLAKCQDRLGIFPAADHRGDYKIGIPTKGRKM